MKLFFLCLIIVCTGILTSCKKLLPGEPEENSLLDGPIEGLTSAEKARFLAGDLAFNSDVFTEETGLGPLFNSNSCVSCHAGDGKGHPFTMLTRFGQADTTGNLFLSAGGPQLQHLSLPGHSPEMLPAGAPFSKFIAPANTGLGFIDALTDAQILAFADPNDLNGDGISGVPNYVNPPSFFIPKWFHLSQNGKYIGRYGRKASAIDLLHQTVNAYSQDIGIVSTFQPVNTHNGETSDPEIADNKILDVVFYLKTLKAPIPRDQENADVQAGKALFTELKCAQCHFPKWETGTTEISALSSKTFYPYSDFLVHDMGPALNDGYTEGSALPSEWRTTPLWGLGLAKQSQGGSYFLLHDGRAHSIAEAILFHGGEAQQSKMLYQNLAENRKQQLIQFLESL